MASITNASQSAAAAFLAQQALTAIKSATAQISTSNGQGFGGLDGGGGAGNAGNVTPAAATAAAAAGAPGSAAAHTACVNAMKDSDPTAEADCSAAGFASAGTKDKGGIPLAKSGTPPTNPAKTAALNATAGSATGGGSASSGVSGGAADGAGVGTGAGGELATGVNSFDSAVKGAQGRGGFGDSEVGPGGRGGGGFGGGGGGDIVGPGTGNEANDAYLKTVGSVSLFEVVSGRYTVWNTKNRRGGSVKVTPPSGK
jgi:hypothetical protein